MSLLDPEPDNLSEDNVYVQELKKVFDDCRSVSYGDGDGDNSPQPSLGPHGLALLCDRLHLSDHSDYIIGQLLPLPSSRITFPEFKNRFIQILPEIVDFSQQSPSERSPRITGVRKISEQSVHSVSSLRRVLAGEDQHSLRVDRRVSEPEEPLVVSDNDTSNDILSDFSDDHFTPGGALAPEGLKACLGQLGLSTDSGYLGRYELRLLCQNEPRVKALIGDNLNSAFDTIDRRNVGRISIRELADYCNNLHRPSADNANLSSHYANSGALDANSKDKSQYSVINRRPSDRKLKTSEQLKKADSPSQPLHQSLSRKDIFDQSQRTKLTSSPILANQEPTMSPFHIFTALDKRKTGRCADGFPRTSLMTLY